MTRWILVLMVSMIGLCRIAWGAVDAVTIYNGDSALPQNLRIGDWGSTRTDGQAGSFLPVQIQAGVFGIPISTSGRYQGTRIDFTPPLDTRLIFGVNHMYLELYLRAFDPSGKQGIMPNLSNLRFTFFTEAGVGVFSIPASQFYPAEVINGTWVRVDLPLSRLDPAQRVGGPMSRMIISSDDPASFLLGRLAVVCEMSALHAEITTFPAILETGQTIFFNAGANGGVTPCNTVWNFNTAAGTSVDATGNVVTYTYTNPGTYLVSCTVYDINKERDSITVTKEIKINRPRN